MVHIDAAMLRKYPILGVFIGGATAVFLCFLLLSGLSEARVLLGQKAPDPVSLHESVNLRRIRWVTLSEGQWNCQQAITIRRRAGLERWLRGPVETTEVPITGAMKGDVLVASFDGAVSCAERAGSPLTGVVGSTEIFTSRGALRRWGRGGNRVAILHVGASPRFALIMLIGLAAIAVSGIVFAAYYLRRMLRSRGRHSARLPSSDPIQPSRVSTHRFR
jgi:hypothetical protein